MNDVDNTNRPKSFAQQMMIGITIFRNVNGSENNWPPENVHPIITSTVYGKRALAEAGYGLIIIAAVIEGIAYISFTGLLLLALIPNKIGESLFNTKNYRSPWIDYLCIKTDSCYFTIRFSADYLRSNLSTPNLTTDPCFNVQTPIWQLQVFNSRIEAADRRTQELEAETARLNQQIADRIRQRAEITAPSNQMRDIVSSEVERGEAKIAYLQQSGEHPIEIAELRSSLTGVNNSLTSAQNAVAALPI